MDRETENQPRRGPRPVRLGRIPRVSLVILSAGEVGELRSRLAGLKDDERLNEVEVVVVRAAEPEGERTELQSALPGGRLLFVPPESDVATQKSEAMRAVDGDIVIFAEDRQTTTHWLERVEQARAGKDRITSGDEESSADDPEGEDAEGEDEVGPSLAAQNAT